MVVSDDRVASEWGAEILRRGGNAVDAAVGTAFALSVTRPHYASLGGGGFLLTCPPVAGRTPLAHTGQGDSKASNAPASDCALIDYREKAPAAATRDLFVRDGKVVESLSKDGALASGVPGVPAGLILAHSRHGKLPLRVLLEKPIQLAEQGVVFTARMEAVAHERWGAFNSEAKRIFGCGGKGLGKPVAPCEPGTRIRQPELARVLRALQRRGADGFYRGAVARKLVEGLRAAGGILTLEDLAAYRPEVREPLRGNYRSLEVVTAPPPSGGGAGLLQMLAYAERAAQAGELREGAGAARSVHALAFAMTLAFADRARFFGDPAFFRVPVSGLLAPSYLSGRWELFRPKKVVRLEGAGSPEGDPFSAGLGVPVPSLSLASAPQLGTSLSGFKSGGFKTGALPGALKPGALPGTLPDTLPGTLPGAFKAEGHNTTHLSVVDRAGGAVALTTTVNDNFGSGFVPAGTGVVMNNEMDDFSAQPGVPNLYGLVGSEANAVAGGKRPLSSMTPTIVRDSSGAVRLVLGAQGGPRITTSVFQALVNRLEFGLSVVDAVQFPRFHQQWKPEALLIEAGGFSPDTLALLSSWGHAFREVSASGRMHVLELFPNGRVWGAPDRRAEGAAVAE
jgi:gamma-glutamyltranspeptidase/glutathione hydrolase